MLFVVLSLLPLLQAAEPPAKEPARLASGWAAIPRSMWLSNYSHAYGAEKTVIAAGSTEDTIVAYNSAQPWSPARGVVNGSFVRMTFGSLELRGKLLPTGYIVWENGSRWLKERSADSKTAARLAKPSGSAPKPPPASGAAKGGPPADDETYSYSCVAHLLRPPPSCEPSAHARPRALLFARQTTTRRRTPMTRPRLQEGTSRTRTNLTNLARPCGSNRSPCDQQRTAHTYKSVISASRTRVQH